MEKCPYAKKCGGCQYQGIAYEEQLKEKEKKVRKLMKDFGKPELIIGMENPYHYRNKVHAVYHHQRNGEIISGIYQEGTHKVVPVEECQIENQEADRVIQTIRRLAVSFKIKIYNEDSGYGLLRHVLVRTGRKTGEMMVVLVTASPVFPSKNNFVKALRKEHPQITTVIQNINDKNTNMVLSERNVIFYGKGYIEDELCGCRFRISPNSFYQVNTIQTEKLYQKAIELACLTGKERVIDAYCGIGTIGLIAAPHAGEVIGVELNRDAVRDAVGNAKRNGIKNARFYQGDAGKFMVAMAEEGEKADVVFMDPPRSGSDEAFMNSVVTIQPEKIVYISCNPETQVRDLKYLTKKGYRVERICPVDMFPFTVHCECIVSMKKF
ncbi:MAG: 23S rRNA (uracil(1939)-C(5))-methyltransferase RlmD [Eubacterium sp.]|nr:23S rRNA (uracil(1939)-C(5))-methyltransferase RlmD [Eubacterium sp.]